LKFVHIILALTSSIGASIGFAQHTPLTSQYLFNGLVINPAYAGSREALALNITHRQQWVGFDGAPTTELASIHAPIKKTKLGLGLMIYSDRIGVSRESGIFTNYAYRLKFRKAKLSLGIGAGVTMVRSNWDQLALQQQNDVSFIAPTTSALRPNFSAGLFYYTKRSFVGLSAPFLMTHRYALMENGFRVSSAKADLEPMLTGGHVFIVSKTVKIKPSTLVRYRPESGIQADLTANMIYKDRVWAGLSYRTSDAIVGMIEVLPTQQWRIGYSYDMGTSSLTRFHAGSHEIMLQYEFGYRIRIRDPRFF